MLNRGIRVPVLLLAVTVFFSLTAFCHEGGKHFMGHVKSVDDNTVIITTPANEIVTFKLLPTTRVVRSGHTVSVHDLKAGERVVVHAKENGKSWEAEEVHLGAKQAQPASSH